MASRKDLLKAQSFVHQRLVKALVDRSPDDMTSPLRRAVLGTFAGVMIGVLIFAGFGIVGWLNPGKSSKWQQDKTVIVDSSSGGVYVYLEGKLYQAYNITSAKLATGGGEVVSVKSTSLKGVPREGWIGIQDAPRQLPDTKDMKGFPIRLCSAPKANERVTTLEIGEAAAPPADNPAVALQDDKGGEYLVIDGTAHRAPKKAGQARSALLVEFGFTAVSRPGNAFILGLPQGSPLTAPKIPNFGKQSAEPVGTVSTIGSVLEVKGQVGTWYVLLNDGPAPISALEARALVLEKGAKQAQIDAATAAQAESRQRVGAADLPKAAPEPGNVPSDLAAASACATWVGDDKPVVLSFGVDTPKTGEKAANPNEADAVLMPPVTGALMQANNVTDPNAAISLVTDGHRYGIADADARAALGYADAPVLKVAPQLLGLVPAGLPRGQLLSIPASSPKPKS